jgi:hypothetical protein
MTELVPYMMRIITPPLRPVSYLAVHHTRVRADNKGQRQYSQAGRKGCAE